jgi:hypothetical protein
MGEHGHDHDDCCGSKKVEVDVCDLVLCGAKIGMMAGKKKDCCAWMQASGGATQNIPGDDSPQRVIIDQTDGAKHIENNANGAFKVKRDGDYFIMAAPQVGFEQVSVGSNLRCWIRVNGVNVDNSNVQLGTDSPATKDVIVSQGITPLKKDDVVEVFCASNNGADLEAIANDGEPLVPSIIFTMFAVCCKDKGCGCGGGKR